MPNAMTPLDELNRPMTAALYIHDTDQRGYTCVGRWNAVECATGLRSLVIDAACDSDWPPTMWISTSSAAEVIPSSGTTSTIVNHVMQRTDGSRIRVLLIADNPEAPGTSVQGLRRYGYQVRVASSVYSGIVAASEMSIDVVLSDVGLPDLNRSPLLKGLAARCDGLLGIAVVANGRLALSGAGFTEFLTKPVHPQLIHAAIQQAISSCADSPVVEASAGATLVSSIR